MTLKRAIEQHKYTILFFLILIFGSLLRLVQLGEVPGGYQMDEAYGAFNAYSLFHSGIDSTGHSYPVYFESWGGGQNALNSYLMLPFMVFTHSTGSKASAGHCGDSVFGSGLFFDERNRG